ncbi:TetR/AcrR family transcriptional regulator [Streptomyces spongiae]|uniref:TetR/AcrR family transcriptional regulator n=1 Tax=Streptomyces spongiae TaxID=565072 RepID=A0A5N8XW28_9ACTN|nr:TetR/AcrR family transcriptional regulator [Streptomyces spongiae]MPY63584.1 TetR/AcrR family transcriptional regulator [Streptomyces spongiae]
MTRTETGGSGNIKLSLKLLWGGGERPSRGPKPGLTLDRIVAAAVGIADAEGLEAVSMRRLSTALDVGTMSLYRYVPGKAELLDLMLERVQREALEADQEDLTAESGWREAVESLARGYLEHYRRHPWLLRVNQARTVMGPSSLRSLEAALIPLQDMGLSDPELISVIISMQSFAGGIARTEIDADDAAKETGLSHEEFWEEQRPFLEQAMVSGQFPMMAALAEDTFSVEFDHFAFGLRRFLDGLEVLVAERTGRTGQDGRRGEG